MKWTAERELAESAARAAGDCLRNLAQRPREVLSAENKDIKLAADREAEALIVAALQRDSPHPILGEESGEHGRLRDGPFWVVDPLDGTLNFSRGLPFCCVSLALVECERPLVGVVYDFHRDELYSASAGEPARLNGVPIAVSGRADSAQAILATGFPSHRDFGDAALLDFVRQVQRFKKVRLLGSAALSLAAVACGRVDAYAEDDIMLWDVAAGLALVEAAGGHISLEPSTRLQWGRRVRAAAHPSLWPGDPASGPAPG
jgi:myo-inositol-1(or 4)-monophosphatase